MIKPYIKNETAVDIICGICDKTRPDCDPADCKWMKELAEEAVDAVPVVRCKYCKYSYEDFNGLYCSYGPCDGYNVPDDFFCKAGERRGTHD